MTEPSFACDDFYDLLDDKIDLTKDSPEATLLYAILYRAYMDLRERRSQIVSKHHQREALRWVLSEENQPWTFIWICDILDLSTDYTRVVMLRGSYFV